MTMTDITLRQWGRLRATSSIRPWGVAIEIFPDNKAAILDAPKIVFILPVDRADYAIAVCAAINAAPYTTDPEPSGHMICGEDDVPNKSDWLF
jgi:hypothetical protein